MVYKRRYLERFRSLCQCFQIQTFYGQFLEKMNRFLPLQFFRGTVTCAMGGFFGTFSNFRGRQQSSREIVVKRRDVGYSVCSSLKNYLIQKSGFFVKSTKAPTKTTKQIKSGLFTLLTFYSFKECQQSSCKTMLEKNVVYTCVLTSKKLSNVVLGLLTKF